jgi:hypothetical protein
VVLKTIVAERSSSSASMCAVLGGRRQRYSVVGIVGIPRGPSRRPGTKVCRVGGRVCQLVVVHRPGAQTQRRHEPCRVRVRCPRTSNLVMTT